MGSLTELGEDLIKFGEELLQDLGLVSKEAAAGEAAVAETGAAVNAAETGAAEMSAAENAAAEAKAAEEAAAAEQAVTAEEKAAQEAEEAEKQAQNEAEEKAEQKEAERAEAEAEAAAITHAEDAAHVPVPVALAALDELKTQFEWIDHFEAEAAGPGVFSIFMLSSPGRWVGEIHGVEAAIAEMMAGYEEEGARYGDLEPEEPEVPELRPGQEVGQPAKASTADSALEWQDHQDNVTAALEKNNPGATVGEQVTLDVTNNATGQTVTIRIDNTVSTGPNTFQLVDAKYSAVDDLTTASLGGTLTPNQSDAYEWIGRGDSVTVMPRGAQAAEAGMQVGVAIQVEPSVQIHVNGPNGSIVVRKY
jgi:hypothetical protein